MSHGPARALGTTIGMVAANAPAVVFGAPITRIIPLNHVRMAASAVFALIGAWVIVETLSGA